MSHSQQKNYKTFKEFGNSGSFTEKKKKKKLVEIIPEEVQTLDLLEKD